MMPGERETQENVKKKKKKKKKEEKKKTIMHAVHISYICGMRTNAVIRAHKRA